MRPFTGARRIMPTAVVALLLSASGLAWWGPELVCWTDDGVICRYVRWVRTK
jgi:hypothetical protein